MLSTFFPAEARSAHSASRRRSFADSELASNFGAHALSARADAMMEKRRVIEGEPNGILESILIPIVTVDVRPNNLEAKHSGRWTPQPLVRIWSGKLRPAIQC